MGWGMFKKEIVNFGAASVISRYSYMTGIRPATPTHDKWNSL